MKRHLGDEDEEMVVDGMEDNSSMNLSQNDSKRTGDDDLTNKTNPKKQQKKKSVSSR